MSGSIAKSVIPLSDSFFHQKIMNKYRKGIGSVFSFPMMIFSKNSTLQKMYLDIYMRFSFHKQNKLFHIISENTESFKNTFSWFANEKFLPRYKIKSTVLKSTQNLYKMVKLIKPELISSFIPAMHDSANIKTNVSGSRMVEVENTKFTTPIIYSSGNNEVDSFDPQQVFYRQSNLSWMKNDSLLEKTPGSIFSSQNLSYPQTVDNGIRQDGRTFSNSFLNYGNYTIIKPQIFPLNRKLHEENGKNNLYAYKNEYFWQLQSNFHHGSPFTFIQSPVLINERTFEMRNDTLYNTSQDWTSLDKLQVRNINYNLEAGIIKSLISKRNTYSPGDNDNLIFQNQQHIEQKIDQIKKIVGDTKKTIEKSISDNFSGVKESEPQININNLSDQVYHTIERRIRIERERKGI
jgi:hypothetical protein